MLLQMWGKANTYLLMVGVQIDTTIIKISVGVPQKKKSTQLKYSWVEIQQILYLTMVIHIHP